MSILSINVGDKAPDFELADTQLNMRKLSEFLGKKTILSFFVAASSPVCETELCKFQDSKDELANLGAQVVALSNDGPFANKAFAEKNHITYPILSDYTSDTIRAYDVLLPDLLHIKNYNAAKRSIFVLDKDGIITFKWVTDDPLVEPDYQKIKEHLNKSA